jgi:hypothetical protein
MIPARDLLARDPLGPTARRQVAAQRRADQDVSLAVAFDLVLVAIWAFVICATLIAGGAR